MMSQMGAGAHAWRQATGVRRNDAGVMAVPVLSVVAVVSVGIAVTAFILQMQEREKREAKEHALVLVITENDELKGQLQEVREAKVQVEAEWNATQAELAESKVQLAASLEAQTALQQSVDGREQEIARLTDELRVVKQGAEQTTKQLSSLTGEHTVARQRLGELEQSKRQVEVQLEQLTKGPLVELDRVVVGASTLPALPPFDAFTSAQVGQVLVINREHEFIVVNRGKHHGATVGQQFNVTRDEAVLGTLKLERVYDDLSVGGLLSDSRVNDIREGDAVTAI